MDPENTSHVYAKFSTGYILRKIYIYENNVYARPLEKSEDDKSV
jgi:hypothetical protein